MAHANARLTEFGRLLLVHPRDPVVVPGPSSSDGTCACAHGVLGSAGAPRSLFGHVEQGERSGFMQFKSRRRASSER